MSEDTADTSTRSSTVCCASVLDAAREINDAVGGAELARMPKDVARLIVKLKRWVQDGDAARTKEANSEPLILMSAPELTQEQAREIFERHLRDRYGD